MLKKTRQFKMGSGLALVSIFIVLASLITIPTFTQYAHAQSDCANDLGGYCIKLPTNDLTVRNPEPTGLAATGLEFLGLSSDATAGQVIGRVYTFGITLVGISALVMIVIGGIQYMTAGGNPARMGAAKSRITSSFVGIALALVSWLLLFTINPDFVRQFSLTTLEPLPGVSGAPLGAVSDTSETAGNDCFDTINHTDCAVGFECIENPDVPELGGTCQQAAAGSESGCFSSTECESGFECIENPDFPESGGTCRLATDSAIGESCASDGNCTLANGFCEFPDPMSTVGVCKLEVGNTCTNTSQCAQGLTCAPDPLDPSEVFCQ